eukprot:94653_1
MTSLLLIINLIWSTIVVSDKTINCPGDPECDNDIISCDNQDNCIMNCQSNVNGDCTSKTLSCSNCSNCTINCTYWACTQSILSCVDTQHCNIICSGSNACYQAKIELPTPNIVDATAQIVCGDESQSVCEQSQIQSGQQKELVIITDGDISDPVDNIFNYATINASSVTSKLQITALGGQIFMGASIYCPSATGSKCNITCTGSYCFLDATIYGQNSTLTIRGEGSGAFRGAVIRSETSTNLNVIGYGYRVFAGDYWPYTNLIIYCPMSDKHSKHVAICTVVNHDYETGFINASIYSVTGFLNVNITDKSCLDSSRNCEGIVMYCEEGYGESCNATSKSGNDWNCKEKDSKCYMKPNGGNGFWREHWFIIVVSACCGGFIVLVVIFIVWCIRKGKRSKNKVKGKESNPMDYKSVNSTELQPQI